MKRIKKSDKNKSGWAGGRETKTKREKGEGRERHADLGTIEVDELAQVTFTILTNLCTNGCSGAAKMPTSQNA